MHINCILLVAQSSCGLDTCFLLCTTRDGFSRPTCVSQDLLALLVPTFSATKDITCYANINHDSRFIIKSVNICIWYAISFFWLGTGDPYNSKSYLYMQYQWSNPKWYLKHRFIMIYCGYICNFCIFIRYIYQYSSDFFQAVLGWELLKLSSLNLYVNIIYIWQKYLSYYLNHIYIWQVPPQLWWHLLKMKVIFYS